MPTLQSHKVLYGKITKTQNKKGGEKVSLLTCTDIHKTPCQPESELGQQSKYCWKRKIKAGLES